MSDGGKEESSWGEPEPRNEERDKSRSPVRNNSRSPERNSNDRPITLYVSTITDKTREPQLKELFGKYGTIEKVNVVLDPYTKASRGFGFVTMADEAAANQAIEALNGFEVDGKNMTVEKAKRTRPRTPTPGRYYGRSTRDRYDPYSRRGGDYDRGYDRPPPPRHEGGGRYDRRPPPRDYYRGDDRYPPRERDYGRSREYRGGRGDY